MRKAFLLLPLALLATVPHAQQKGRRVGFVDVQQAVTALPGNSAYLTLSKKVDNDLKAKQDSIRKLATRAASTRSNADLQALQKAQQSFVSAQKGYQQRLATEFKPLASRINSAVASVAKANGYSVVMDRRVAAQTNLVVYANSPATDLTAAVIKALKK
ncbi:hypothetical protein Dcar01_00407 [Deinococcus carri]|uniref:Outer membrane chaperone OmpH n=1 Tax=Deinococcus carri TaxID=1211323 RepID=A0ABP9W2X3_9DEIO